MSNTTAEYWDVDGVSLNTEVQNLTSWGGSREAPPQLRGKDRTVPYKPGGLWVPKIPDIREMELSGWLVGPTPAEARVKWRKLRALLWRPHEQFMLTRRWKDEYGNAWVATGQAQYVSGLEPDPTAGGSRLAFKVKLRMVDPFFYSSSLGVGMPPGATTAFSLVGDYPSQKVLIQLIGPLSDVVLRVMDASNTVDNTFRYTNVASGAVATINTEAWTATELLAGNTTRTAGKVGHSGRPQWLYLPPTTAKISLSATGTGSAAVVYNPAFL